MTLELTITIILSLLFAAGRAHGQSGTLLDLGVGPQPTTGFRVSVAPVNLTFSNKQTVTLLPGQNLIHGLVFGGGSLWATTVTLPGLLLRFSNTNDISQYTTLTFSSDGLHDNPTDVIYDPVHTKVYVPFVIAGSFNVSEVSPLTLSVTDRIDDTHGSDCTSITSDGSSIFLCGADQFVNTTLIGKYSMADWSLQAFTNIANTTFGHCIRYDGTNVFCTTHGAPSYIIKLNPSDLSYTTNQIPSLYSPITDDLAFFGNYVWLGSEAQQGKFIRVSKTDLSMTVYSGPGGTDVSYGIYFDGSLIGQPFQNVLWQVIGSSPGKLERIDPNTANVLFAYMAGGEDLLNEVVSDGVQLFMTCFTSPAKVIRLTITSP